MTAAGALAMDGTGAPPALALHGITKRFGSVVANDDVSLTVLPGEVHALLGENGAGKTTLMNVVFGLMRADAGEIEFAGSPARIRQPRDALELGIGMVHQHFKLVPDMTVAENIALASGRRGVGRLGLADLRLKTAELSDRFGLSVDPDGVIEELSVGEQQRVEILKLLYRDVRLLILDEPTGALTPPEWKHLREVLRSLVREGRTVVFISHKLEEVFGIASRCTVLRDGRVVGTRRIEETTKEELARLMVGREVSLRVVRERLDPGRPVLEVRDLRLVDENRELLRGIDLTVREREVVGIAGVEGNGQRELIDALTGMRPADGEMRFDRRRCAVIPDDRQHVGLALDLSLEHNLMLKDFDRAPFARRGLLNHRAARERCERLVTEFDIRTPSIDIPARQLSGGNQQKAVVARELDGAPRLLIASQPTRGLDVGAMEFVYARLAEFKQGGGGTLLFSAELDEILSISDRIAVMVGGRLVAVIDADDADPEVLGLLMAGERVERERSGAL